MQGREKKRSVGKIKEEEDKDDKARKMGKGKKIVKERENTEKDNG